MIYLERYILPRSCHTFMELPSGSTCYQDETGHVIERGFDGNPFSGDSRREDLVTVVARDVVATICCQQATGTLNCCACQAQRYCPVRDLGRLLGMGGKG